MNEESMEERIDLQLSRGEIMMLLNAINETLEAVEEWEFSARVGCSRVDLEKLREKLGGFVE